MDFTHRQVEKSHYESRASQALATLESGAAVPSYETEREHWTSLPLRETYLAWESAIRALSLPTGGKILDYCAGTGFHSVTLQKLHPEAQVTAIDISRSSLEIGQRLAERSLPAGSPRPTFLEMDAHQVKFPDGSFDCVTEFGSLQSLEFDLAIREIHRVLKPGGVFISVETFGHNPIGNFHRWMNVRRGRQTQWAAEHIIRMPQLRRLEEFFDVRELHYLGLATLLAEAIPPLRMKGVITLLESLDRLLFKVAPFLKRYAFKVVFVGVKRPS